MLKCSNFRVDFFVEEINWECYLVAKKNKVLFQEEMQLPYRTEEGDIDVINLCDPKLTCYQNALKNLKRIFNDKNKSYSIDIVAIYPIVYFEEILI